MGIWDEYCLICGGPIINYFDGNTVMYDDNDNEIICNKKEYNWLNNLILILSNEQIIKLTGKHYADSGKFVLNNKLYIVTPINYHSKWINHDGYGVICHQDCYKLIEYNLHHKILFSNIAKLLHTGNCLLKNISKYKPMDKYISQLFDYYHADQQNKWLLDNPLKNNENKKRILNIWKPLIIQFKKYPPRPSPAESATAFTTGTILIGYNKEKWIVKNTKGIKKWIQYNKNNENIENIKGSQKNSRKVSKKGSRKNSKNNSRKGSRKNSIKGSKKSSKNNSKKGSTKNSRKGSKKSSKNIKN